MSAARAAPLSGAMRGATVTRVWIHRILGCHLAEVGATVLGMNTSPNTSGLRNVSPPVSLSDPCPRCTTGKGPHSCPDFPLPAWSRGYLAALDTELGVDPDARTPRYVQFPSGVAVIGEPSDDPAFAQNLRTAILTGVLSEQSRWAILRRLEAQNVANDPYDSER